MAKKKQTEAQKAAAAKRKATLAAKKAELEKLPKFDWMMITQVKTGYYGQSTTKLASLHWGVPEKTMMQKLREAEVPAWLYRVDKKNYVLYASSKKVVEKEGK